MRYLEYEQWLQIEHSKLILEPLCIEIGPLVAPTTSPAYQPPWNMDWAVIFQDGMFFVVRERWYPRKSIFGGGGYRKMFSFHYGAAAPGRDRDGIPARDKAYQTIIRVDIDWTGPHIHYLGEDHIPQPRVRDFSISDADPFRFATAVLQNRASGTDFAALMGFTVTP